MKGKEKKKNLKAAIAQCDDDDLGFANLGSVFVAESDSRSTNHMSPNSKWFSSITMLDGGLVLQVLIMLIRLLG